MISIEEAKANVGRAVVYSRPYCDVEEGTITGASSSTVFVLYRGDLHSKGTNPEDLTFTSPDRLETVEVDVAPQVVDLVAALRASVEATAARRSPSLCLVGRDNEEPHAPHEWFYTASGGGHQMDRDDPTEKHVRRHYCPGIAVDQGAGE